MVLGRTEWRGTSMADALFTMAQVFERVQGRARVERVEFFILFLRTSSAFETSDLPLNLAEILRYNATKNKIKKKNQQ